MFTTYGSLLRLTGSRGLVVAGLIGRFPLSMLGIGVVLLIRAQTGSYGLAGTVSGTLAVATALAGPLTGALADHWGQRRLLPPLLGVFTLATAALLLAASRTQWPIWILFPAAIVAGAAVPQIGAMTRRRWKDMVGAHIGYNSALSLESVLDAGVFVVGPVLAAFLATSVWPGGGVAAATVLAVIGGTLLATQRATEPPPRSKTHSGRSTASRPVHRFAGVWVLIAAHLMLGICFGSSDLSVIAFAQATGHAGLSGAMLAAFAVGSVIAGMAYGAINWRRSLRSRFALALLAMAALSILLVLSPNIGVMAGCALIYGLAVSPALIAGTGLMEALAPPDRLTEGFTWLTAATGVGIALGSSLAGQLIDLYGPNRALLLTTSAATAGTLIAIGARSLLPLSRAANTPS